MSLEKDREFEESLKAARPLRVRPELMAEIQARLDQAEHQQRISHWRTISGWGGLAVAASILVVFGVLLFNGRLAFQSSPVPANPGQPEARAPVESGRPEGFQPVLAENNLKNRVDEGIVFLRNGLTARRYRYEFVDRVVWENPADGAIVEVEIPRDEVVLVPVQTF